MPQPPQPQSPQPPVKARAPRTVAQVAAVLRMRAATVRGMARARVYLGLVSIPLIGVGAAMGGAVLLPLDGRSEVALLLPTAWLGFAVMVVVATAASGPRVLLPRSHGAAFPVTAAADHLGALILAPLNIAWLAQAVGLVVLTSWAVGLQPQLGTAQAVTVAWIVFVTVSAQAVGWVVELARTAAAARLVLRTAVAAGLVGAAVLTASDRVVVLLDHAPTIPLVAAALSGGSVTSGSWALAVAGLVTWTAALYAAGAWLAARVQRRPARLQEQVETRRYPARPEPSGELAAALRIDRAGVWRSAPLRRGMVALGSVPALAAAAAQLEWQLVVFLPCLVTAGVALLFGVNAFCLDGAGAMWRESLPGSPLVLLGSRLIVVAELCVIVSAATVAVAALRAPALPTVAETIAVAFAVVATTAQVVGRCATWSVERPYAATLRDARDQPAPPAAMAAYSARLALGTAVTGLVLSSLAELGLAGATAAMGVAITCIGVRRTALALRRWENPRVRARVIATVAGT